MQHRLRQFVLRSPVALTVAGVTVASVGLSVLALFLLTELLSLGYGGDFKLYLSVAIVIPLMVAAPVSWLITHLLREVEQARQQAQALAWRDELTGLYNRRRLGELVQREVALSVRNGLPLAAVLMDMDDFKLVNDRHGHAVGDLLLAEVARVTMATVRSTDLVARWGGEEFALVLPATGAEEAQQLLQRVMNELRGLRILLPGQGELRCTASLGLAVLAAGDENFQRLIDRADHAMYLAKAAGKDRVVLAEAGLPDPAG